MSQFSGLALLCNVHGDVANVLSDSLGLGASIQLGMPFARLAAPDELDKALSFITEVNAKGMALDWEINLSAGELVKTLCFTGRKVNDVLLIVGSENGNFAMALYEEMMQITNAQVNALRAALKDQARDEHLFDEISRLNNELISTQRELAKLNAELEQRVSQRTRELREAQEQLVRQEKLAVLGQLAGGVGHELRNPLAVINSAVYYLKLIQPEAGAKVKEYLDRIEAETRTAEKIITDLLGFARVKAVDREPVAVPELVQRVLERFPAPAPVSVTFDFPPNLPQIHVDGRQVEQVLGNLVLNACQAMPSGGTLSVMSEQLSVEGVTWVRIAVKDTGSGITPENMKKLFEPLFTTKAKGIGLGLAVSQKLVEANGGRIEVESEAGVGSTFTLWLPIQKEPGK